MPTYVDQLSRAVDIPSPPRRIVSLVPSQTEFLFDLGLEKEVVGITKFCVHPQQWFRQKERIGGTKNVHIEKVKSLQPDLIIANKEENVQAQVEELAHHFPVWVSDVNNLEDAYAMMHSIGDLTNRGEIAHKLASTIRDKFAKVQIPDIKLRTAYLIWKDPYMTAGGDTFIHHLLETAGFHNCFTHLDRYPQIAIADLQEANCELLFLSSEPYPFKQSHIAELQAQLRGVAVMLVDGEMFSWYGSRLQYAPSYFQGLQQQVGVMH